MLTVHQSDSLARQLVDSYDFPQVFSTFTWNGEAMPVAWNRRQALESAARGRNLADATDYAERVHRWGFKNKPIRANVTAANAWPVVIQELVREWGAATDPLDSKEARDALRRILEVEGLGLATVTKWICFLDQGRFAIYDSRVSYALRQLAIDGKRVFPFVGSRETKANRGRFVYQEACVKEPGRAVTTYVNFIRVVRTAAALLNEQKATTDWTPARVECVLFMLGRDRLRRADILPLSRELNRSYEHQFEAGR